MTAPQIYNDFSIGVSSEELMGAGIDIAGADPTTVGGWIGDIVTGLKRIEDTIKNLKLGWVGQTADEANEFFDRWMLSMSHLFGTTKHPEYGTLVLVATALRYSADNYNNAEDTICSMLSSINQGMTPKPDGGATPESAPIGAPAVWITEWWQGAVSEVF